MTLRFQGSVAVLGTFDSKAEELSFLTRRCLAAGLAPLVIDVGLTGCRERQLLSENAIPILRPRATVQGKANLGCATFMREIAQSAGLLLVELYESGKILGAIAAGGGRGSYICGRAMQALPLGVPKVLVSTVAGQRGAEIIGATDIVIFPSVTDIVGLNPVLESTLDSASICLAGLLSQVKTDPPEISQMVGLSALGVTTRAATQCSNLLKAAGLQPTVFHSNGFGGQALEKFVAQGSFVGVIDLTLSELVNTEFGSLETVGPRRLEAAGRAGIPQVILPGGIDFTIYRGWDSIPLGLRDRNIHEHAPNIYLVRSSIDENLKIGRIVGARLKKARCKPCLIVPLRGLSDCDTQGEPFYLPDAITAFVSGVRIAAGNTVNIIEVDRHINDVETSVLAVNQLLTELTIQAQDAQ